METKIIIAGSGGQGILFLGKALTTAGTFGRKNVTWFPSYGAEMRGGTANCTVIISDEMIGSPVVLHPDILVTMNSASLDRFQPMLKKRGLLLYDSSLIREPMLRKDIRSVGVPATGIAGEAGSTKSANMVMLGAFIALTGILDRTAVMAMFEKGAGGTNASAAQLNRILFTKGAGFIEDPQGGNS
ncbi:MAG: 2-oxoacid:acceptor oxidoreductase family protein [Thermodesulfovibrionales bacterium]